MHSSALQDIIQPFRVIVLAVETITQANAFLLSSHKHPHFYEPDRLLSTYAWSQHPIGKKHESQLENVNAGRANAEALLTSACPGRATIPRSTKLARNSVILTEECATRATDWQRIYQRGNETLPLVD